MTAINILEVDCFMDLTEQLYKLTEQPSIPEEQGFVYDGLDSETKSVVQQRTCEIKSLMRQTTQSIIDIGQKLTEVKQQLGHGNFRNWLKTEFEWGVWTATKFIQVADKFKYVNFTHLNVATSALYLLAAPSTPEQARAEALERASLGENITSTKAKVIVSRHKEAVTPKPDKSATVDVLTKTVKCNSSTVVKPLDQPTSISKDEFSFELVKDAPEAERETVNHKWIDSTAENEGSGAFTPAELPLVAQAVDAESTGVIEQPENKLSENPSEAPAHSQESNHIFEMASATDSGGYPPEESAQMETQSLFKSGRFLYIADSVQQNYKLLGEISEVKVITANDLEVIVKISI